VCPCIKRVSKVDVWFFFSGYVWKGEINKKKKGGEKGEAC
jgi:hypothetical protein